MISFSGRNTDFSCKARQIKNNKQAKYWFSPSDESIWLAWILHPMSGNF